MCIIFDYKTKMRKRIFRVANPIVGPATTAVVGGLLGESAAESIAPAIGQFVGKKVEELATDTKGSVGIQEYSNIIDRLTALIPEYYGDSNKLKNYLGENGFFANPTSAIKTLTTLYKFITAAKTFIPQSDMPNAALKYAVELFRKTNSYETVNSSLSELAENSISFGNDVYVMLLAGDPDLDPGARRNMNRLATLLTISKSFGKEIDSKTLANLQKISNNNVAFFGPKSKDFLNFSALRDASSARNLANLEKSLAVFNVMKPNILESEAAAKKVADIIKDSANSSIGEQFMQKPGVRFLFDAFVAFDKLKDSASLGKAFSEARGEGFK